MVFFYIQRQVASGIQRQVASGIQNNLHKEPSGHFEVGEP
jgi:hypothetical protein